MKPVNCGHEFRKQRRPAITSSDMCDFVSHDMSEFFFSDHDFQSGWQQDFFWDDASRLSAERTSVNFREKISSSNLVRECSPPSRREMLPFPQSCVEAFCQAASDPDWREQVEPSSMRTPISHVTANTGRYSIKRAATFDAVDPEAPIDLSLGGRATDGSVPRSICAGRGSI